ncbi:hypothetical protein [Corynebacterium sp.]|uniref:hypothetical protein n=1 Tax=Corynebacterium sp. TaxID=1720 RepID=UPI0028A66A52|nr:hypothetical protein [Corynebacterium sp.]
MSSNGDVVGGTWKFNRASGEKRRMARRRKQREEARRKEKSLKTSNAIYPLEVTEVLEEADQILINHAEDLLDNLCL